MVHYFVIALSFFIVQTLYSSSESTEDLNKESFDLSQRLRSLNKQDRKNMVTDLEDLAYRWKRKCTACRVVHKDQQKIVACERRFFEDIIKNNLCEIKRELWHYKKQDKKNAGDIAWANRYKARAEFKQDLINWISAAPTRQEQLTRFKEVLSYFSNAINRIDISWLDKIQGSTFFDVRNELEQLELKDAKNLLEDLTFFNPLESAQTTLQMCTLRCSNDAAKTGACLTPYVENTVARFLNSLKHSPLSIRYDIFYQRLIKHIEGLSSMQEKMKFIINFFEQAHELQFDPRYKD